MAHESGPWYERLGIMVSVGGGGTLGNGPWYEALRKVNVVTGKVPGVGIGGSIGIMAVDNIRSLHDVSGEGIAVGGSVYDGLGGAADYLAPPIGTPDPYTGIEVGIGVGLGAEVHFQKTYTWVLYPVACCGLVNDSANG
jgi:hypothetical protein